MTAILIVKAWTLLVLWKQSTEGPMFLPQMDFTICDVLLLAAPVAALAWLARAGWSDGGAKAMGRYIAYGVFSGVLALLVTAVAGHLLLREGSPFQRIMFVD